MKWFHHECAARHDPKLQVLGSTYGAEGIGIYWGLLEDIGQHSDTFHLKLTGISPEIDQKFSNTASGSQFLLRNPQSIPRLPLKILSKNLFTSPKKLKNVIELCVEVGLFDSDKWLNYNLLYSPSFEQRADDYTRRVQRQANNIRTELGQTTAEVRSIPVLSRVEGSEDSQNNIRTKSDKVLPETDTEQKKNICNTSAVNNLSTDESFLIELSDELFDQYCLKFHSALQLWNRQHGSTIDWNPKLKELKKLFSGGEYQHKLDMCFHAYKILGNKINYPELVMRALHLFLEKYEKSKIDNPFGWLWTCLHGNGNGKTPWVQLMTAEEEQSLTISPLSRGRLMPVPNERAGRGS
ncbi:MAG: DUF4373 domain-containing protein [Ignavibacteriales bacterium]|nr:DUF4373 domain-containing protein [Ignavibacteriales bacterium]